MTERNVFLSGQVIDLVILEKRDAPTLNRWIHDSEVTQYISRGALPMTRSAEEVWIDELYEKSENLVLGIWHKQDQLLIGSTGLHRINQLNQTASFGIVIGESAYWGQGIGTAVLDRLCVYGFETRNLRSITLSVLGNNPRAQRCYEKVGFQEVGRWPQHVFKNGTWHDEVLMIRTCGR